ncbi:Ig-like domain-containing protein [Limnobaculum parvum]|uniref:Bacterial Ig-like domain-containing protein n=1 Tax=Limnobaculum parvum TaxID=2172103 RepID=A0A2Y9TZ93_9GAMM|nr:Ig-like domain-containing protein [Limnobaculum parvum]AWH88932.1 hypothetical protein HYN51_10435 [Limnobaculum parvum]
MNNNVSLLVNSGSSTSQVISLNAGKPIKIKIQPGCKYLLKNKNDNYAPENVTLQRNGDDLYVVLEGDSAPAIVIQDYYVSGNNEPLLGMAEDGQLYAYVVTDGSSLGEGYQFENGAFSAVALGGMPLGDGAYLFNDTDHDFDLLALWPWFLGVAALGALAAVAFNNDDDNSSPPAPQPASVPTLSGAMDATGDITGPIVYGSSTDEKNPTIYGTGDAGNTITIYDNGNAIGNTVVAANGQWSFKPAVALSEGDHKITITQTNPSGLTSAPSDDFSFTVDTSAPSKPLFGEIIDDVGAIQGPIANGDVTDDARPEMRGTGEPGDTITIYINGKESGKTIIDAQGKWSFTPATDLADGDYQITITESDKAGNISPTSSTFDFTVDTTSPVMPTIDAAIDDVGTIQGRLNNGGMTDDSTPTLIGRAEINSIVKVYDGSTLLGSAVANGITGEWSFTPAKPISEGKHSFHITSTDKAGNTSQPSADFTLTTDYTPPDRSKLAITGVDDQEGATTGNVINNGMTDDTRPTISGTGTAGDTIVVYVKDATGNHEIGSTLVDADGKWSLQPMSPLLPGNNQFTAVESDPVGNATTPSDPYSINLDIVKPIEPVIVNILDDVGPIKGPLQKGSITDDNQPTITGTAEAGHTVRVYDGVSLVGSAVANSKGVWTLTPTTALADGKHSITATATNPDGRTGKPTGIFDFEVDTKLPDAIESLVVSDNVGEQQGPLSNGDTTDDSTPTFSGKAGAETTVTIYDNGNKIGEAKVDSEGDWVFVPSSALPDGKHEFTATVTDKAGNTNAEGTGLSVIIDTSKVLISISALIDNVGDITGSIKPNSTTDDTRPEIIGQGKVGSLVKIYDGKTLLGQTTVKADGTWSFTPENDLKEGKHSITATATDLSGNVSSPTAVFEFIVDISAPSIPTIESAKDDVGSIQGQLSSGGITDDSTPTLTGKAEKSSIVTVYDGIILLGSVVADGVNGEWSFTPATPISEGEHKFRVTATDAAGNISKPSADFLLTTDYTSPDGAKLAITGVDDKVGEITGNITSGGSTDDSRPTISGTGTAGDTIVVYAKDAEGNHEIGSTTVNANGKWSLQPVSPLLPGNNEFTAIEMDPVGNSTDPSAPYSIKLDVSKPLDPTIVNVLDDVGPITEPLQKGDVTDDNKPTIVGTAQAGHTVRVYDGVTLLGSVVSDSKGVWTFTPVTELVDGKHTITATATSAIGQTSKPTGDFDFEVDTKAPSAVENLVIKDNVGDYTGVLVNGDTTDDNTPTFEGKAEAGSVVTVYDKGSAIGSTKADMDGKWSFTPSESLTDGDYTFSTKVTDKAGNTGVASPEVNITIDTSDVLVSITRLVDNVGSITGNITPAGVTDDVRPEIIGTGKSGSIINLYDNGGTLLGSTTAKSDGSWSFTPSSDLSQGAHSITATATDKAGNTSKPSSAFTFSVDIVAPEIPTIESAQDDVGSMQGQLTSGSMTDDPTPTLSGKAENGSIVKVYDGSILLGSTVADDTTGEWHFTPVTPIIEGAHKFHATATDAAGNTSKPSADFSLITDYTVPDVSKLTITDVDDQAGLKTGTVKPGETTDDTRPTISGTGTKGDTIIVFTTDSSGKHEIGSAIVDASGKWNLKPTSPLLPGKNDFTAMEVDPVGNQAGPSAEYSISVSITPPEPPVITRVEDNVGNADNAIVAIQKGAVTNDNTPTLVGTAVANGIVTIYNNDVAIGSVKVGADSQWTFTPSPALKDGTYAIRADASDPIGQLSVKTGIFDFTVDTTPPGKAENLVVTDNEGSVTGALTSGDTTDDSTPTFSGKAEANCTVTVYNGSTVVGVTTADSNGNWQLTPSVALKDGDYIFTTKVTDPAGNTGAATDDFKLTIDTSKVTVKITHLVDDVAAITGDITPNGVTNDARPEIIGEGKLGSIIKVYDNESTLLGSTTVKADGTWSFTPATALSENSHSITATATDKAGNTSAPTSPFVFSVDTLKPEKPTIESAKDDVGDMQGTLVNNGWTDDPTPTLSGKAEKGSIVKVYDGDGLLGSVIANSDTGTWSFTPVSGLAEGEHTFTVTATDKAGNVSDASNNFVLNMDFTIPDISKLKITDVDDQVGLKTGTVLAGETTDDTRPTISGTGTKGDVIIVSTKDSSGKHVIGSTTVGDDGKWSLKPVSPLLPGKNDFSAMEIDPVGNKAGPSAEYSISVSITQPEPPVITRVEDNVGNADNAVVAIQKGAVTNDNTPTLVGTAVANGIVTIYNNDVAIGSVKVGADSQWTFTPSPALKDGTYAIRADASDPIGQLSVKTGIFDFTVDTTPPGKAENLVVTDNEGSVTGALTSGDTTDDSTPTFSGKAEANCTVTVYNGSTVVGVTTADSNGNWQLTPSVALKDGDYTFTTKVTDPAGNTGAATDDFKLTIDTSKVTVKITHLVDDVAAITGDITPNGVTNDARPEIIGEGKVGSIIKVYDNESTLLGSTSVKADGTWSFTPSTDLSENSHSITATATDKAGNTSAATTPFVFSVDTIKPEKPTIESAKDDVGDMQGTLVNNGWTDDPTPTLSGKAEKGSIVKVYDGDGLLGSVVANISTGTWSFTPESGLAEGAHTFTVTATDKAGNVSDASNNFVLNMDFTIPDISKLKITDVDDQVGLKTGTVLAGETTDDTRPTISGTGTKGDVIIVSSKDSSGKNVIGSTTVGDDGKWSLKPVSPLLPGKNDLSAMEIDPVGNKAGPSAEYSISVSITPPEPPVITRVEDNVGNADNAVVAIQKGAVTNDNTPTLVGSAVANGIVTIYNNGVAIGSVKVGADSQWTFTPSPALKDGLYTIQADAINTVGQSSVKTGIFDFTVDTTPPGKAENLVVTDNEGSSTGALTSGDTTDDSTPTFSGKAEANCTVTVYNGSTVVGVTTVDSNGNWQLTPSVALKDGDYTFTTKVTDPAGNTGAATDDFKLTIDTSKVTVKITHLVDDVAAITGDIAQNGVTNDARPEIIGEGKLDSIIKVYDNESTLLGSTTVKADGTWSFTPSTDLSENSHSITATATDKTGNTSAATTPFVFLVDTIKPEKPTIESAKDDVGDIQDTLANNGWTDDPTPTLNGKAEKGSIVKVYDGDGLLGSVIANSDTGAWSFTPESGLDEGAHTFTVTAMDKAGNTSDASTSFILNLDFTIPDISKLKITGVTDNVGKSTGEIADGGATDDNIPTIHGTATAGDTIIVYVENSKDGSNKKELGRTTVDSSGNWKLDPATALADGGYKFTAVEMDLAGNKTPPTTGYIITIDTYIPVAKSEILTVTDNVGPTQGDFNSGAYIDDSTPVLNGKIIGVLGAKDRVAIFEDGIEIGTVTVTGQTWKFEISTASLSGGREHIYTSAVVSAANIEGDMSDEFKLTSVVEINAQTTLDTTPIISGRIPYSLDDSMYLTVTVNGKTYSSLTGVVVVDTVNSTWYVQLPAGDALAVGTYEVAAKINSTTKTGTWDMTANELIIAPTPAVIIDVDGVDGNNKGTTVTMNNQGGWQLFTNQAVLDSSATSNSTIGEFKMTVLTPNTGGAGYGAGDMNMVQNATFVDFNRDGYMDILGIDSRYSNGQQMFINNADGTYTAKQMADTYKAGDDLANTYSWYGGVVAIDLMGDGYVDLLVGDQTPNDANAEGGYNSQIVFNNGGVFIKDDWYTDSRANGGKNTGNATFDQELSGVDLDNNGTIDVVFHATSGSNKLGAADGNGATNGSSNRLVVAKNDGNGKLSTSQMISDVFRYQGDPNVANEPSMTWADFNGDGYMDLFLGSVNGNSTTEKNSTIYFNDGLGNLMSSNSTGIGTSTGTYKFNDTVLGGASLTMDWNGDGKMDIVEAPQIGSSGGTINMYTNTTTGGTVGFSTSYLQSNSTFGASASTGKVFTGSISGSGTVSGNPVTGMISIDLDYDGAKDLLIFTSNGKSTYVHNQNVIADGTSLHLRIVDAQGLTVFYGNTVQLIDSKGKVVATQMINPQAGGQGNESTSIVDFYGLNPTETYSVVMLRNVAGVSQDIGGVASVGTNTIENVNLGWANIKAGAANEALVLTAEAGTNTSNTLSSGIVGTGYNDTFMATQGTKKYEGGGGTTTMSDYKTWTNTGGVDIVDFKLAGNTALTIDMSKAGAQVTGWNTVTLSNIEGISGAAGNDIFTDNSGDNVFEGRGGNDTFHLINGGRDTLMYKVLPDLNGDGRGGNGSDTVKGFTLGAWEATPDADCINVKDMLVGYSYGGGASWINGVATMAAGETIGNYLKVTASGDNTQVYIDRDGTGGAYGSELLLTLEGVKTDLVTLMANHQVELGSKASVSSGLKSLLSISQMYTSGDDMMFGTDKADILMGGLGNDTFVGVGSGDNIMGGAGNDVIKLASTDFDFISGDEGIDTLILETKGELLDLSMLKDKLHSVEIFDMGDGQNTMKVSLDDVLRLGSEELAINSGDKAIIVNGEEGSTLKLESGDGQWAISQSHYQHAGNTYNVWTLGASGIEVLVENTVNPIIM